MNADNPYRAPERAPPTPRGRSRPILPSSTGMCILLSLLLWPMVAFSTDLLGALLEPTLNIEDFGLAASNITLPITSVVAIALWFHAFLQHKERSRPFSIAIAIGTLPLWFVATAIATLCFFPFGRISDRF